MSFDSHNSRKLAVRSAMAAGVVAVGAAALLVASAAAPIAAGQTGDPRISGRVRPLPVDECDLQPLLKRVAMRELIRPANAQAAVKDDGSSQQLLKALKLQGVIEMNGKLIAYIQVEKAGIRTVLPGQKILEFNVESIEPGRVVLSLKGVEVALEH